MNKSFDVFLSHNSRDKPVVRELAELLRDRGLKVWLDEWELVPGRPWQEALEEVIESCRSSTVLVGKDGLGPWHTAEMRGCLTEFVRRRLPVIPVLLPGASAEPKLPLFLTQLTWIDLRGGLTEEGLDRLYWGITGKRPDRSKIFSAPPQPRLVEVLGSPSDRPAVAASKSTPEEERKPSEDTRRIERPFELEMIRVPERTVPPDSGLKSAQDGSVVSEFFISKSQITNGQFDVYLEATGASRFFFWPRRLVRGNRPGSQSAEVTWDEAVAFCRWLRQVTALPLRLPTEIEWGNAVLIEGVAPSDTDVHEWCADGFSETGPISGRDPVVKEPLVVKREFGRNYKHIYNFRVGRWKTGRSRVSTSSKLGFRLALSPLFLDWL